MAKPEPEPAVTDTVVGTALEQHFRGTALINISIVQPGISFQFCTPRSMRQLSTARVQPESLARIYVQSQTPLDRINSNRGKEKSKKPFRQHLKEDDLLGPC